MRIEINKKRKIPLYLQIESQLKRMILAGNILDGAVLPSERKLAEQLGVHRNTVIRAYADLKDMGLVRSDRGKGYSVCYSLPEDRPLTAEEQRPVNWSHVIKDEYLDMEELYDDIFQRFSTGKGISLSAGMPPFVYPEEEIADDIVAIMNENQLLPAYSATYQGDGELLRRLQDYVRTKGIEAGLRQIQVLKETNQALDYIITAMTEPGDCVFIEEPCSPDVYRMIALSGCEFFTVPVDLDGMVVEQLEPLIETKKPKFIYVNSSYQDPTGNILSLERRRKLLELSNRYRIPIVEDDAGSEMYFEDRPTPPIKSMDRCSNVIYIYSFSLTFVPGMTLAFVVADEKLVRALSYLVSIHIVSIGWITQKLLARNLKNGTYQRKCREIADHSRRNRDIMCAMLDRLSDIDVRYIKPRGGVYIWVRLPPGLSGRRVAEEASRCDVAVVPGEVFYPTRRGGKEFIRLNYSYESAEWLTEGMDRLVRVIKKTYKEISGENP
ncbi:hypothetical protein BHK98_10590 [Hornefia porci]|uniref:HTH gntR-type domain-containing protein n=1 Tax=Hornefia porci TaxID=2652292 RepID=A0A1Q9JK12_9FIRM|nr:PLP-dependent aminotransferase family protein [Hornefia porci]OLR56477.1 hypothetical protein BHK98_10590 [Hornefia porci]